MTQAQLEPHFRLPHPSFFGDEAKDAFWSTLSSEEREDLVAEEEALVAKARVDIGAFFEYVMREQTTREPVNLLPHQAVGLSFMLHHDRSVNMWPVGHSKTFCTAALTLFLLGNDPTLRGAVVSATQEQSKKILAVVADYILHSPELHRVFPNLQKSPRSRDPWTQVALTVDRPPGIPDASLFAVGIDGGLPGARLNWIVVDDILNRENTATKEGRDKVYTWFDSTVLSRLDPIGARVIVTNTTWHPDDLVHRLEKLGWPSLRMDVLGNLKVQDDAQWMAEGREPYDHDELRPASSSPYEEDYRLRSHDPDPTNDKTLWPEKFSKEYVDRVLRFRHLPSEFNRAYMNVCRDDGTSMCKQEFIDLCKKKARDEKIFGLVSKYDGPNPTFTGLDLAVSPGEENDDTAFFTIEVRPDGMRVILDIEIGQWDGPTIIKKLFRKQEDYNSVVRVENNGAQDYIRQFALQTDRSLPIMAHTTGRAKAHPEHGVPGIFLELSNGAWLIPNNKRGECSEAVQKFIDSCLYYSPSKHTDDVLMAAYFAREQAKKWGLLIPDPDPQGTKNGSSVQASVMAR